MVYPEINPVAFDLGFVQVYWYGIMYLLAFISAYLLGRYQAKKLDNWDVEHIDDLIFFGAIGVIVGGRLGYMAFYDLNNFITNPLSLFSIQDGGMSFHGGFLGVILAMVIFSQRYKKDLFETFDFVVVLVPLGLFFGRIGNFINGELWGKITSGQMGMYIQEQGVSRYPSQLYEAILEGLVLFLILWWFSSNKRPKLAISALFLVFYGLFRFIIEFVRVPDVQLGYLAYDWLTMGQMLSLPMVVVGVFMLKWSHKSKSY